MQQAAESQRESVVIDEPNNPIDEPSETPPAVPADPEVGEAKAAPMAVAANGADPPAEPEVPQAQPLSEPPDAPAEEAKTPEEPQTGEAAPPPAEEAELAETPVEEAPPDAEGEVAEAAVEEKPVETSPEPEVEEAETPVEEGEGEEKPGEMDWYILKVQSNREDSIRDGLLRRVAIAGLDRHFGQVIVPVEQVTEFKGGKKRVTKRKLYPGYLVVQMEINDDTWFLVRETPGIGDFTGAAGHPTPMLAHEVNRILARQDDKTDETPKLKIAFNTGDQVKINEGTFENFEGEVHTIDQTSGRVTVMINIFGRSTPVELEYWQIESI